MYSKSACEQYVCRGGACGGRASLREVRERSCSGAALKIAESDTLREENGDKGDHLHH